jgi:aryl-alcohol dehydrogenase-like predicted oxidoreductase
MEYRRLGNSGMIVSVIGLGTMQFGEATNVGRLDQKATTEMIRFALDHGVNFIDTADVYSRGESETLIGNALKGYRENVVLATKVRLPMSDTDFNRSGSTRAKFRAVSKSACAGYRPITSICIRFTVGTATRPSKNRCARWMMWCGRAKPATSG